MALASGSQTAGVVAGGAAHGLLSLATIGMAAAALVVSTLVVITGVGLHGANGTGTAGAAGASGANGANGAAGPGTTWGTLTITFSMGGKAQGLSVSSSQCTIQAHGAYACVVSVASASTTTQKLTGLSYPENPNVYYAGADPTIGWIVFNPGATTTFTLWFQAVQVSGNSVVPVTLLVNPAGSS